MTRPGGATAVVPLRDGVSGKSRLAAVLDPGARRRLVRVLARHVVGTLLASDGVDGVVVVTADPAFTRESLAGLDVEVLEQPVARPGLNAALEHAREVLAARAPSSARLLVAHADLPALTRADVMALLAEPAPVVIATDRNRSGTNLLLVPPPRPPVSPSRPRSGSGSGSAWDRSRRTSSRPRRPGWTPPSCTGPVPPSTSTRPTTGRSCLPRSGPPSAGKCPV
nr:hypothetical protein GCM10025730_36490 [Promicromonospora thailandica]